VLGDITVDTNVLVHAQNPSEIRFEDAVAFLNELRGCETKLCVDRLFAFDHQNTSLIGHEYVRNLNAGGFAFEFLRLLLNTERVKSVATGAPANVRKIVLAIANKRDRTFVLVAYNSADRLFTSHDWEDFPTKVRENLKAKLDVTVEDAASARSRL
jgi:hypothetical protein